MTTFGCGHLNVWDRTLARAIPRFALPRQIAEIARVMFYMQQQDDLPIILRDLV